VTDRFWGPLDVGITKFPSHILAVTQDQIGEFQQLVSKKGVDVSVESQLLCDMAGKERYMTVV
jgi:hypothetical protein